MDEAVQNCIDRANGYAANDLALDREIQAKLQAPLPDALLSWKPGTCWKYDGKYFAVYFPYVDDAFLELRLDAVLGQTGWMPHYSDNEKLTICDLALEFPSGPITRQGVAFFASRDKDEGNSEKGARTMAFRDACKHFGICGRDIDGAQTRPVEVDAEEYQVDGKTRYKIRQALEVLDRTTLLHSGQSTHWIKWYSRPRVLLSTSPGDCLYFAPDQAEEGFNNQEGIQTRVDSPMQPPPGGQSGGPGPSGPPRNGGSKPSPKQERGDYKDPSIKWTFGKFNGVRLLETETAYLVWAVEKGNMCNPEHEKYDNWMHKAIQYALHQKTNAELEERGETGVPWVDSADAKEVLGGRDLSEESPI